MGREIWAQSYPTDHGVRRHCTAVLVVLACVLTPADAVQAQRNVQLTPDQTLQVVNKQVGEERWAITRDLGTGVVTGNVYQEGGDPQYLWCWPQSTESDPLRLRCQATSGCGKWTDLGEVEIAASFFEPTACETTTTQDEISSAGSGVVAQDGSTQSSSLRYSPDGRHSLISKDVGGLRWTVSYNNRDRTIVGNVLDPMGGPSQFLFCRAKVNEVGFECSGAHGCGCGACRRSDWTELPDVVAPPGFLGTRRCPTTGGEPDGLVAELQPSALPEGTTFGQAIAISDGVAIISSSEPAVYFFESGPNGWQETARIGPVRSDTRVPQTLAFGVRVAISGSRAAAIDYDVVRVFERTSASWALADTLTPPEEGARVRSLAISGDRIAMSVDLNDETESDRIHVYEKTAARWRRTVTISPPGNAPFEYIHNVALEDGFLVYFVTASQTPRNNNSLPDASLEVLEFESGDWVRAEPIEFPSSPLDLNYPTLALAGSDLFIGSAPGSPFNQTRGSVRWVARQSDGWTDVASFASCATDVGRFGQVLAASQDTLVVGAPDYQGWGGAGEAHVLTKGNEGWSSAGRLRVGDVAVASLALDGSTLLVAPGRGAASGSALVQVFDLEKVDLLPPVPCPEDPPKTWPGEEWKIEPAIQHGMNPQALVRAGEYALAPGSNTQGVVVARNGVIVAEWYEDGRNATSYGASWSVAKSIAGALIGVAIERGDVRDEYVSMAEFYPDWAGTAKEAITLRNVLQMSSGLRWSESHATTQSPLSDIGYMASVAKDQLSFASEKPVAVPPGSRWEYSSGDSMLLSGVIESATGLSAGEYAKRHLFQPLGMSRAEWWSDATGHTLTYCCVDAPSREFARLGLLFARNGRWNETQLLPERWVRDSAAGFYSPDEGAVGYGYQWYPGSAGAGMSAALLSAEGFDVQWIYVIPELDLVVVRNGHYDKHPGPPIADPNLFDLYPAAGLVPGLGTKPPEGGWSVGRLLELILEAVVSR